jgi:excisionase family DNA binding protein
MSEELISSREAAEMLDVSIRTVQRFAANNKLAGSRRVGRTWVIPKAAVEDYKREQEEKKEKSNQDKSRGKSP